MHRTVSRLITTLALSVVALPALAANADPLDLDPNLAAKVAKEKMKASNQLLRADGVGGPGDSSKCGQVDIGNDSGQKSASQRLNARDKTVVITGPVINAARCR